MFIRNFNKITTTLTSILKTILLDNSSEASSIDNEIVGNDIAKTVYVSDTKVVDNDGVISRTIKNLLTVANLAKFKKLSLAKFKKSDFVKNKKSKFTKAIFFQNGFYL